MSKIIETKTFYYLVGPFMRLFPFFHYFYKPVVNKVSDHQEFRYGIFLKTNIDGTITFVNEAFCKLSGFSSEELIGQDFRKTNSGFHSRIFFKEMWETVLKKEAWRGEIKNQAKDGKCYWVDTTINASFDADGKITELTSFMFDITERKIVEDRLIKSESRLRLLFDQSVDPVMTLSPPDWKFNSANPAALKLFGVESLESFSNVGPGDLSPKFQENGELSKELAGKFIGIALKEGSHSFNWLHKKLNGPTIPCTVLLSKIVEGDEIYLYATVRDITQQTKIKKQLIEAQAISKIGSWSMNLLTHEQIWSEEHYKIFEIDFPQSQEHLYSLYRSRIHPDDLPMLDQIVERAISFGEDFVFDHRVYLDNGARIKYVQGIGKVQKDQDGKPIMLTGTCRDKTRDVEQELRYQNLLESMGEGLVVQDSEGKIIQCNSAAREILEINPLDRTSKDPDWKAVKENGDPFPGEEHPAMLALSTGKSVSNVIMGLKFFTDKIKWLKISAIPITKGDEKTVLCTFSDITELVLTKEENKFTLDTLGIGVWKFNPNNNEIFWDNSMYKLFDLNPADFSGHYSAWENSLTPSSKKDAVEALAKALSGEKDLNMTFEVFSKNNEKRALGVRGKVIRNSLGEPLMVYGINWDKTKEVELELSLETERAKSLHNAKLASIGQLAAGVGHEINNPLTIISGSLLMVEKTLKDAGPVDVFVTERISQIQAAVTRIANIVKGLRVFARSDDSLLSYFSLHELILESVDMLKDIYLKEQVELSFFGDKKEFLVHGNRGRIQQVIINLISNAKDSSENKAQRWVKVLLQQKENEVCVVVSDNGSGIPENIHDKIFNPFFTTKEINKGTGIGLSVVSTIIKEHNGKLDFKTEAGEGTQFSIYLPLVDYKKAIPIRVETPVEKVFQFNVKVLIVDDEPELREIFKYLISKYCSEVQTAADGKEAFKLLQENHFDLVLSDVKMPNMDGFKLLEAIRGDQKLSQVKFVLITGGVDMSDLEEEIIKKDANGILPKPSTEEQIMAKLEELFPAG